MLDGVGGIFDARSPASAERVSTAISSAVRGSSDVIAGDTIAAARSPSSGIESTSTQCLIVGRIHDLATVARLLGLADNAPSERVVATAYDREGTSALRRFAGAFVVVVWDSQRRRGVIASDNLGTRSLYYREDGSRLTFASDVRLILQLLASTPSPDEVAVVHWLANTDAPENRTLYQGVRRVGAGFCLELEDGRWRRTQYWSPRFHMPEKRSRAAVVDELWDATVQAVHARLSNGPTGIIMSGGIDSATVAAAAASASTDRPRAGYSAVFPGDEWMDESERITGLTDALRLPGVQIEPEPAGAFNLSLDYLDAWDLPLIGSGYLLEQPLLARAAADGVTAVLDGQGGDELFGLSPYLLADRVRQGRIISSFRLIRRLPSMAPHRPWRATFWSWKTYGLKPALPPAIHARLRRRRMRTGHHAPPWLSPAATGVLTDADDSWDWQHGGQGPLWWLYKLKVLTRDRERVGLPEYLRHRAAMAGIEARPPLMDARLIETALRIPPELDFDPVYDRPLIREALRGRIPEEVRVWRRKSNLAPFYHRAVSEGDIAPLRRLLLGDSLAITAYVDVAQLRALLDRPPRFGEPGWIRWLPPVWRAATAECWLRRQEDTDFVRAFREGGTKSSPRSSVRRDTLRHEQ